MTASDHLQVLDALRQRFGEPDFRVHSFPAADGDYRPVHVPDNLFVIGTMNIADRSLALVPAPGAAGGLPARRPKGAY